MTDSAETLAADALTKQSDWFYDFYEFQTKLFWGDIRSATGFLVAPSSADANDHSQAIADLGNHIRAIVGDDETLPPFDTITALGEPIKELAEHTDALRRSGPRAGQSCG